MAFDASKLACIAGAGRGQQLFIYDGGSDAMATCVAANYFATANTATQIAVGDVILIKASDSFNLYRVTAIDPVALTSTVVKAA